MKYMLSVLTGFTLVASAQAFAKGDALCVLQIARQESGNSKLQPHQAGPWPTARLGIMLIRQQYDNLSGCKAFDWQSAVKLSQCSTADFQNTVPVSCLIDAIEASRNSN